MERETLREFVVPIRLRNVTMSKELLWAMDSVRGIRILAKDREEAGMKVHNILKELPYEGSIETGGTQMVEFHG